MKIERSKVVLPFIGMVIILSIISYSLLAQASKSEGCEAWHNLGTLARDPNTRTGISSKQLFAGEILRVSFTLGSATNATANLESPSGSPIQQQSFSSGSVSFSFVVPSDGIYSVFGGNDHSSNGNINVTFTCQSSQGAGSSNSNASQGFTDGRINYLDGATPIVVYPYQDETGSGLDIYSTTGSLLMRVTGAEMAVLPIYNPTYNITVSGALGGYQITAPQYNGKTYVLQFPAPYTNVGYTSWEVE